MEIASKWKIFDLLADGERYLRSKTIFGPDNCPPLGSISQSIALSKVGLDVDNQNQSFVSRNGVYCKIRLQYV